jgi:adenylate cyclase
LFISDQIKKTLILTAISFILSVLILLTGILENFELKAFDLYSRYLNPKIAPQNIIIVQVDQRSIDDLKKQGVTWPWPRQIYAPILEYMSEAKAVFVDVLFTEPSSYGVEDDEILSDSIKKAANVYLPVFLSNRDKVISSGAKEFLKGIAVNGDVESRIEFSTAIVPLDILRGGIAGSGNVTISPDDDGVYRKIPLFFKLDGFVIPHFLIAYLIKNGVVTLENNNVYSQNTRIPLLDGKLILRYFTGNPAFKVFSASEVLKSYLDSNSSVTPTIKKEFFKGRYVFLGFTAPGLYDLKPTSVKSISTGVLIHATTLENIINQEFIRPAPTIIVVAFLLLICFFTSYFVLKSHSLLLNLSLLILSIVLIGLVTVLLFKVLVYFEIIAPVISLVVTFAVAVAYSYATEGKQRVLIENTLLQYMDKKIAEYLLDNPNLIKPGGTKRHVTVFFADIAGFTTISEVISPEEVAVMLHKVLNSITKEIIDNNGVIDKYIGDCVMAFWGAPLDSDKDELNACLAGLRSIQSIESINEEFGQRKLPEISVRIGIHTGEAIAGNIGSDRIFNYTVIGDSVNLASRIESINRYFKTSIIVSEDTIKMTEDSFFSRELGLIEVKGKNLPVRIFELIGKKEDVNSDKRELVELYNQGLKLYQDQKWQDALEIFEKVLSTYNSDGPSEFYKSRCESIISNSLLTEDSEVIKFTQK